MSETIAPVLKGLSISEVRDLLSKGKSRNIYGPCVLEFINSDEAGVNPREAWPINFETTKASAMYQSFNKAVKDANLEDVVQVKQHDSECFLIHKERYALAVAAMADEAE
jgi:hypothetical protein